MKKTLALFQVSNFATIVHFFIFMIIYLSLNTFLSALTSGLTSTLCSRSQEILSEFPLIGGGVAATADLQNLQHSFSGMNLDDEDGLSESLM